MNKYILTMLLSLVYATSHAATSISTTLTLTSPTAYISMTGVSAKAYLTGISSTLVTATTVNASTVSATTLKSTNAVRAWVAFTCATGVILDSTNVSSVTRIAAGDYGVSFTTAFANANYAGDFNYQAADGATVLACVGNSGGVGQATTGSHYSCYATGTGAKTDATKCYAIFAGNQ